MQGCHAEFNAFNTWKLNIYFFDIIDSRISLFLNDLDHLSRRPTFTFRNLNNGSRNSIGSLF